MNKYLTFEKHDMKKYLGALDDLYKLTQNPNLIKTGGSTADERLATIFGDDVVVYGDPFDNGFNTDDISDDNDSQDLEEQYKNITSAQSDIKGSYNVDDTLDITQFYNKNEITMDLNQFMTSE